MRIVLQRVARAAVLVDGVVVGEIGRGVCLLVGCERGDGERQVETAADKLSELRIFEDERGKMNLGPRAAGAAFLVVSQFTLAASTRRGRRPSFDRALAPAAARVLIDRLIGELELRGFEVRSGAFGVPMRVELDNDGPVTLVLDFEPDGAHQLRE